jgi:cyanate lyase
MKLTTGLKRAMRESGRSYGALSRGTGLALPIITRFANGERSLKIESADKLAAYLGLELRPMTNKRKRTPSRANG